MKEKKKKTKSYVAYATKSLAVVHCYAELLRMYYHDQKELTGYHVKVGHKIENTLKQKYNEISTNYLKTCETGSHKDAKAAVRRVLEAIGPKAFNEQWFIEGLKSLYMRKIRFQFPIFKNEVDFGPLFEFACKAEKRFRNNPVWNAFNQDATKQSDYYREFPKAMDICFLHYLYGVLNEAAHKATLEDIPKMDAAYLDSVIREIDKNLPN